MDDSSHSHGDSKLIRWVPDTCFCVLIIEDDFSALVRSEQKCKLHKNTKDANLLETIHNFNMEKDIRLGDNPTKEEILSNDKLKLKEKGKTRL